MALSLEESDQIFLFFSSYYCPNKLFLNHAYAKEWFYNNKVGSTCKINIKMAIKSSYIGNFVHVKFSFGIFFIQNSLMES